MKSAKLLTLILFAAVALTPTNADAQFRKLRDRVKNRAEERAKERAEEKADEVMKSAIDDQVDKIIDAAFEKTEKKINDMVASAFSKDQATIDLENNVIKQDGQSDVELKPNETSPGTADYVQYLNVTMFNFPAELTKFMGNGSYQRVYLHGDKQLTTNAVEGTLLDLDAGHMASMNYADGTYWIQPFADFGAMMNEATNAMKDAGMPSGAEGQGNGDSDVAMDFDFEIREGTSGMVRGSRSKQHFVITKTTFKSDDEEAGQSMRGNLYSIAEVWTTTDIAGGKTMQDFGLRVAQAMGQALSSSETGQSMSAGIMGDPRIGPAMEEASKKAADLDGFPVQTETYLVMVPEDQELDLEKVIGEDTETDLTVWANSMSDEAEPVEDQVTMFSTLMFVSNLTTDSFSDDLLVIKEGLEQQPSPMERMREYMQQSGQGN